MPLDIQKQFGIKLLFQSLIFIAITSFAFGQVSIRSASQISTDTTDWMKKVANWQLKQSSWNSSVSWERGALHAGLMACYETTKDETYLDACRQYADSFNWQLSSTSHHADNNAVGQVFVELYLLDEQNSTRIEGTSRSFKEVSNAHIALWPDFNCNTSSDSNVWWWCDALFMAPPGLVRLSRATGDTSYTDLMHKMWSETQSCLYDTTEHLFFRDINYFYPDTQNCIGNKMFWSRGNGWVLAGTARMLQYLPLDDPNRSVYITLLQEMSAKLKEIQQSDGYWHSDLLGASCYDNPETSGTGFFTFGIAWGINNGLIDETTYVSTIMAGWDALKAGVQSNGMLGWVQPVGEDPKSTSATTTDVFGVGAYLLAGSEVYKYQLAQDPNSIECFESYTDDTSLATSWNDGSSNGTSSTVTLGDFGDNFMELSYNNNLSPYYSETEYTFASSRNFSSNNAYYLSVLVRGNTNNDTEPIYVRIEDSSGNTSEQIMDDTSVVQIAEWYELGFQIAEFGGIDITNIKKIIIGVGSSDASVSSGAGTIRIDNIRLNRQQCSDSISGDLTLDCQVNLLDFEIIANQWLDDYKETVEPIDPGTTNLAAYWPMDGYFNDRTGNGYDATAGSSVSLDSGQTGQSAYFDATDFQSYLYCQNSTGMNLDQGATISAWIKSDSLDDQWASVVTKGVSAWRLIRNSTSSSISFHFNASGGGEYQANGSTSVIDNQWHHLCGVYDGSHIYLYIDGQLDASSSAGQVKISSDPVYIGSRINNTADRNWIGNIDEVRIYDIALSESNILYLADAEPLVQIEDPRDADLYFDGVIDIADLEVIASSWLGDSFWP